MYIKFSYMRISTIFLAVTTILINVSCDKNLDYPLPIGELENLLGKWLVYEQGYSPGSGYIITEVPDEPAQILTFKSDSQFSSNYSGLEDFFYFLVLDDASGSHILALYEKKSEMINNQDINSLEHSYSIEIEDGNIKLYFRYCIEGCHIGLKKME